MANVKSDYCNPQLAKAMKNSTISGEELDENLATIDTGLSKSLLKLASQMSAHSLT